mmetsp:Transcript_26790/g.62571  ORF Transcript_26790/g.62571 Transcript_26790/m.62571 type:complete len:211 (-) Transcript_26790:175-807(-)
MDSDLRAGRQQLAQQRRAPVPAGGAGGRDAWLRRHRHARRQVAGGRRHERYERAVDRRVPRPRPVGARELPPQRPARLLAAAPLRALRRQQERRRRVRSRGKRRVAPLGAAPEAHRVAAQGHDVHRPRRRARRGAHRLELARRLPTLGRRPRERRDTARRQRHPQRDSGSALRRDPLRRRVGDCRGADAHVRHRHARRAVGAWLCPSGAL